MVFGADFQKISYTATIHAAKNIMAPQQTFMTWLFSVKKVTWRLVYEKDFFRSRISFLIYLNSQSEKNFSIEFLTMSVWVLCSSIIELDSSLPTTEVGSMDHVQGSFSTNQCSVVIVREFFAIFSLCLTSFAINIYCTS